MAAKRTRKTASSKVQPREGNSDPVNAGDALPTGPTGRHIITMRPGTQASHIRALQNTTGLKVASTADFEGAVITVSECGADALLYEHLDIAIIEGDADQINALEASVQDVDNPVLSVEPEVYVYVFGEHGTADLIANERLTRAGREYMRGYLDGIQMLSERLLAGGSTAGLEAGVSTVFADTPQFTWGLQATKVDASLCKGSGIRVAVLDTGFDLHHPDFAGRSILSASFVPGVLTAQDGHGHGTHCVGTACGPLTPAGGVRRYGIASGATILVGKVLSDSGSGYQGWIMAGINWAIQNRATVISVSLGSRIMVGEPFSPAYEHAAQAALNRGSLIVAAAGNDGLNPVGSPANCPSVMAVAAVNPDLARSDFSCIGLNPNGGEINLAAPGRNVFSSVPMPTRYNGTFSGTSMATPHVSGIAALWSQNTGMRGMALWQKLTSTALNIGQTPQMVGAGLVQAPDCRPPVETPQPVLPAVLDPPVALPPDTAPQPPLPDPPIHIPPIHSPGPLIK